MKLLWFDSETTGLDPVKNDIIQVAGKIVVDDVIKEEFNLTCQPHSYEHVDERALQVNKRTLEEIKTFPSPIELYRDLSALLGKYIDRFNRSDKFVPAGQNVRFDINFLFAKGVEAEYAHCGEGCC